MSTSCAPDSVQPGPAASDRAGDAPSFGAILLAGGLATRLGDIARDIPKAMLSFDGVPFLSLVLRKLSAQGCTEVVVVVGHLAEVIEKHIETLPKARMAITAIRLPGRGTGASLLAAMAVLTTRQPFFCINADTILEVDFPSILKFHQSKSAEVTAVLTALPDVPHWGAVAINSDSRIVSYDESNPALLPWQRPLVGSSTRMSNCGHYCFTPSSLDDMATSGGIVTSLELDIMPAMAQRGKAYGYNNGLRTFLDFGTVERFRQAQAMAGQLSSIYPADQSSHEMRRAMRLSWNQVRFFREAGYLRMPGEVAVGDIREMRDTVMTQIREAVEPVRRNRNGVVWRLDNAIDRGKVFRRVFLDSPTILEPIESLLGPNIEFMLSPHNHASINIPGLAETRLHRDILQWSSTILTVIVYLEDATEANGCTRVVPTSHRLPGVSKPNNGGMWVNEHAEFDDFRSQAVPVPMPSGGILLLDGFVFHATGRNRSNRMRPIVTMGYRSIDELVQVRDANMVLTRGQYVYKGRT